MKGKTAKTAKNAARQARFSEAERDGRTMLEKSVNLHVAMIKGEIKVSAVFVAAIGFAYAFLPILSLLAAPVLLIPLIICGYRVNVKLFRRSLYGKGAELYQLLPLSPRDILLGKAGAMLVLELAIMAALIVPAAVLFFRPNVLYGRELFSWIVETGIGPGLTPLQKGILSGLCFIAVFIAEFAYCMYMVMAQNLIQRFTGNYSVKIGDYPCVIAAGLALGLVLFGGRQLAGHFQLSGTVLFWFVIGKYALTLATGLILYCLCRGNLEKAYGH